MSWVQSFHDEFLMHTLLIRKDHADLEKDISFLTKALRIGNGSLVLDQCCGIGSIAIPLSKRGFQVVGVDITPLYIENAKAKSSTCELYCEDARTFTYPNCDGIFNWWTGLDIFQPMRKIKNSSNKHFHHCVLVVHIFLIYRISLVSSEIFDPQCIVHIKPKWEPSH